ncbi:hypothetical protein HanRHA438_Chr14g0650661 [Helianthus annuus]|uniref:Uncharacterized protein n=1 Tax=Helianthus annuus TaxID=4232 RepID=A0A9K3H680_HELAN|nr:hypothetical protein HanXRQr2_Chr14g0640321 [Helianthus annuus]KAJ0463931.1 hypothetical protein HanHA300_Chr14g0521301 [Helianthus annuus]KAJ0468266.1 hypothetical protein HanIR_Chr14g0694701 [Helianthus annuus]KAJ0485432.1 hypothetical protein HanHA89_Chr14g0568271 [Helianthus annuus]KAJ0655983.1 hypothetical protein HanLR1_Chr14g0530641 [Helianthus annuus]
MTRPDPTRFPGLTSIKVDNVFKAFIFRELSAVAGAITITCLMVANLVGFVVGPSGVSWLKSVFLHAEGLPTFFGLLVTFYIGTKVMFHVSDSKQRTHQS